MSATVVGVPLLEMTPAHALADVRVNASGKHRCLMQVLAAPIVAAAAAELEVTAVQGIRVVQAQKLLRWLLEFYQLQER